MAGWTDWGATVGAVLALPIAIAALVVSVSLQRRSVHVGTIHDFYELFHELTRLRIDNWRITHLLELQDGYEEQVNNLRRALGELSAAEREQLLLVERAAAFFIFETFERSVIELHQARSSHERERAGFLELVVGYFVEKLLRNPRLVYYWSPQYGNVRAFAEQVTQQLYDDAMSGLALVIDVEGPYQASAEAAGDGIPVARSPA